MRTRHRPCADPIPGLPGLALTLALALLAATGPVAAATGSEAASTRDAGRPLVLGMVSNNPKKHLRRLQPIVDYVADRLTDVGLSGGKVVLARDNEHLISLLRRGAVDWVTETPFSASIFHRRAGAEYLLRRWRKGTGTYHSVVFVRKDSDLETLDDLRGNTIAFEDPGSTSSFFVPAADLLEAGHELVLLDSPREAAPEEVTGYLFSRQEVNTVNLVLKGLVQAGALSSQDWVKPDFMGVRLSDEMRIIHRSRDFPRAVELVRSDLDPRVKERLRTVLLEAHADPQASKALRSYQKTTRFDALDAEMLGALAEAGRMVDIVAKALN